MVRSSSAALVIRASRSVVRALTRSRLLWRATLARNTAVAPDAHSSMLSVPSVLPTTTPYHLRRFLRPMLVV